VRQQPAKEEYFSYLTFLKTLEQVLVTWFFPQSQFFLLFHLYCIAGLSYSFSSHGFSHQHNSLAFFFFKHLRQGTCSSCRWVFSLERMVVVVVTTIGWLLERGMNSFSFHGFGHFCLFLAHPSSPAFKSGACILVCSYCRKLYGVRKKARARSLLWKECPFLSPCYIYTPLKYKRVLGRWTKAVLILPLGYPWAGFYSHSPLG